jgi:hypothetical protein
MKLFMYILKGQQIRGNPPVEGVGIDAENSLR